MTNRTATHAAWARPFLKAPSWLYSHQLGWLLGKKFLVVTHVGRKSGIERQTVLEVVKYDKDSDESIVVSAYGKTADWYRNLQAAPSPLIRIGRVDYMPEQRFLELDEARGIAVGWCEANRFEARFAIRVLAAIGAVPEDSFSDPVDLMASFPMVGFRPRQ